MRHKPLIVLCLTVALAACKPAAEPVAPAAPAAPPAPAEPVAENAAPFNFQCGDERIAARFDNVAGNVTLSIGGQPLVLPQAVAASGARYADDKGNEFWNKGNNATLTLAGKPAVECAQTELASPWDQARERGVGFRAVGQEPGWFVEVGQGETPDMHLTLDNGTRQLQVLQAQPLADGAGFNGKTKDGVAVELRVAHEACADVMSGEAFETSAQLKVDDQSLNGCGRFLTD